MCQEHGSHSHFNATRADVIKDSVMGAVGGEHSFFQFVLHPIPKCHSLGLQSDHCPRIPGQAQGKQGSRMSLKDWHLKTEVVLGSANKHSFKVMLTSLGSFLRHHQVFICVCRGRMRRQLG